MFTIVGFHAKAISTRSEAVTADAELIGPTEELDLLDCGSGFFAIRNFAGRFLTAQPEGKVEASAESVRDWERYRLVRANQGRFGVLTFHDSFLCATPEGELVADRTWLRDWEEFYFRRLPDADEFDPVSQRDVSSLVARAIEEHGLADPVEAARGVLEVVGGIVFPAPAPVTTHEGRRA
jgi:hypothetical protein